MRPVIGTSNKRDREKWLKENLASIEGGSRILDAGAGELQYKKYCAHLDYVSQDFAEYDGRGNGSGLQMKTWKQDDLDIISDITSIPEPDLSFDAVMCIEVLEHLPDPTSALIELTRILRINGIFILTAPFTSITHFAPYHFCTGFNRYYFEYQLGKLGYKIEQIVPNGNYFEFVAQELHRVKSIANRYCNSKPTLYEAIAKRVIFRMLARFAKRDRGSDELLCFGYQIFARKTK